MSEKEIAKEILQLLIEKDYLSVKEFPETSGRPVEMVCEAYKKILKAVSED